MGLPTAKTRALNLPRYHFVVQAQDRNYEDPEGTILPGRGAARKHGHRIVRELKEGGYHPPGATLHVLDDAGWKVHSIPY
jgi:hypothetical protein